MIHDTIMNVTCLVNRSISISIRYIKPGRKIWNHGQCIPGAYFHTCRIRNHTATTSTATTPTTRPRHTLAPYEYPTIRNGLNPSTRSPRTHACILPSATFSSDSDSDANNNNSKDATELHQSYHDQLLELEQERMELFGTDEDGASGTDAGNTPPWSWSPPQESQPPQPRNANANDVHEHQHQQDLTIHEMNQDREAIYNFTKEETQAWTTAAADGTTHGKRNMPTYNQEFLNAVQRAREAKALYEQSLERDSEEHARRIAKDAEREMELSHDYEKEEEGHVPLQDDPLGGGSTNQRFTHLNPRGDEISMVDVGEKDVTRRTAVARTAVVFPPEVMSAFGIVHNDNDNDNDSSGQEMIGKKGPIFSTARLAGIMGAKRTSDLIPLCHPLPLDKVHIDIRLEGNRALIECECRVTHKTGVEMEALAGASIAALTIYDMVKAVSHRVRIEGTELVRKTGGKRDVSEQD